MSQSSFDFSTWLDEIGPMMPDDVFDLVSNYKEEIFERMYENDVIHASQALFAVVQEECDGDRDVVQGLLKLFFYGHLHATSCHYAPLCASHAESQCMHLRALADAMVFTDNGQERYNTDDGHVQRGYVSGNFIASSFEMAKGIFDASGCCYTATIDDTAILKTFGDDGEREEVHENVCDWSPNGGSNYSYAAERFQTFFGDTFTWQSNFIYVTLDDYKGFTHVATPSDPYGIRCSVNEGEVFVEFMMWDPTWPDVNEDCSSSNHTSPAEHLLRALNAVDAVDAQ